MAQSTTRDRRLDMLLRNLVLVYQEASQITAITTVLHEKMIYETLPRSSSSVYLACSREACLIIYRAHYNFSLVRTEMSIIH
jgi:hypothetical protein